ncbi:MULTISPECIES: plasmid partitioning protein RepB [unclassified Yoonia]|uniref:plasmid partitioning protein RepB n=1 Tax=unclassified Yoonia TaxID=2629118 RepID=UPI002AFDD57F|nr:MULTISPECIES: plasmid partitioning protein RepB [unclassified Yoonia]
MARRNLFQPPAPPDATAPAEPRSRFPNTGAMSGMKSTLKDLSSNAVRDIPVDQIIEGGPQDRLAFSDVDVASLAQSIRQHGQQVPIMVRPAPDQPGLFQIIYGRRRLRALRVLGLPAKALVRSLSDSEAVLAQGQENAERLDPSFIEKALFAAELANTGYDQPVILDALAIDKPMLSRMTKVARAIPEPVIQSIGSAHGIGRRRWEDLADLVRDDGIDLTALAEALNLDEIAQSDDRFARLSAAATQHRKGAPTQRPPALSVLADDGTPLAEVTDTARALTLKLSKTQTPEFARWMHENAETTLKRLYAAWQTGDKT